MEENPSPTSVGTKWKSGFRKNRRACLRNVRGPNSAVRSLFTCPVSTSPCLELNLSFYRHPSSRLKGLTKGNRKLQAYIILPLMHNPQERASLLPYLSSPGWGEGEQLIDIIWVKHHSFVQSLWLEGYDVVIAKPGAYTCMCRQKGASWEVSALL